TPQGIAVDGSGAAYVTGTILEEDFPVTSGAYQTKYPGGFALKLNSAGSGLVYSTFLGGPSSVGSGGVQPTSIAIRPGCVSACSVAVAGVTFAADFPLVNPVQSFVGPIPQAFLVGLASNSAVQFSTYLGSADAYGNDTLGIPAVAFDAPG